MIVNNYGSTIGTQNNVEITAATTAALAFLQQASSTLATDALLSPSERASAQTAVASAAKEVSEGKASRDTLLKSLAAVAGIGSVASLISKVLDLF